MTSTLSSQLIQQIKSDIKKQQLPDHFLNSIEQWIMPIAESIAQYKRDKNKAIIISFNGAQGSGKSTLTHFIALILTQHFKLSSINVSIDNFYLSKQQREQLALNTHPLLKIRGVPGTHDLELAVTTLTKLSNCSAESPCFIPQFDKATDDRLNKDQWLKVVQPIDIILFEGWCNHAPVQSNQTLETPLNTLEQYEDADGIWRNYVNQQLQSYHQRLFSLCDLLYFIKIPNVKMIYEWRGLQEHKLAQQNQLASTMQKEALIRFIQHFERITRQCLESLPKLADSVIELDNEHQIISLTVNKK